MTRLALSDGLWRRKALALPQTPEKALPFAGVWGKAPIFFVTAQHP